MFLIFYRHLLNSDANCFTLSQNIRILYFIFLFSSFLNKYSCTILGNQNKQNGIKEQSKKKEKKEKKMNLPCIYLGQPIREP